MKLDTEQSALSWHPLIGAPAEDHHPDERSALPNAQEIVRWWWHGARIVPAFDGEARGFVAAPVDMEISPAGKHGRRPGR